MEIQKWAKDKRFLIGIVLAHILLYFSFDHKKVFWYIFTASMLFLISYAIVHEEIENESSFSVNFFYGIISGALLFGIFFLGDFIIDKLNLPFQKEVSRLYKQLSPKGWWHYAILLLIIVPGEEIFWRGFIQKRLEKITTMKASIIIASLLYASAHFYSGTVVLPLAALICGLFWGILYSWKKSIPLVIVSHLVFSLCLFLIFPLR